MRLISSFSICSHYELGLLKSKLLSECEYIDTWIITDNCYSTRRDSKEYAIQDGWFNSEVPNLTDRIIYNRISSTFPFSPGSESYHKILQPFHGEGTFFFVEQLQRLSGITRYIESSHFDLDSYVFVSDVDEILIIKTNQDYNKLLELLKKHQPSSLSLVRHKFLYDYDNLTNMQRTVPLVSLRKSLKCLFSSIAQARLMNHPLLASESIYSVEFHNCLPIDGLVTKYKTYPHPKLIDNSHILQCLKLNIPVEHLDISAGSVDLSPHTIDIAEQSLLPSFIRANLSSLKLNTISPHYKQYRIAYGLPE